MTFLVHPTITATLDGVAYPVDGGTVALDVAAIPYASASIRLPLTAGTALEDLDPRDGDRVTVNASNTGTWSPNYSSWVEKRRNLATNPNAVAATGFVTNSTAIWTVTRNVAVPAPHPQGITTAAMSQNTGTVSRNSASMYNIDALGNAATVRSLGAWVYVDAAGYEAALVQVGTYTPIPPNVWTWITATPAGGNAFAYVRKDAVSGNAAPADRAWVTGVMATTDGPATETVWGGRVPANAELEKYSWVGTANASASIYQTRESLPPTWTPATPRTFDLGIRSRTVDHAAQTVDLTATSDEALLTDYATLVTDTGALTVQMSLRGIVNYVLNKIGATLAPGGPDVPMQVLTDAVNMFENGSIEGTGTGTQSWAGANVRVVRLVGADAIYGTAFLQLDTPTAADSYATLGGDYALLTFRNGMSAGKTYTVSANFRPAGLSGTVAPNNRARSIVVIYQNAAGNPVEIVGTAAPNTSLLSTRVKNTFTLPADAKGAAIRFYMGHSAGAMEIDGVRLSEDTGRTGEDTTTYFDGSFPDTTSYSYKWNGAALYSTSTRTALIDRAPELLIWMPGVTAWNFLSPIVTSANMRLSCDEHRVWTLIYPEAHTAPGHLVVTPDNATRGSDTITRDDEELFCTGVVVRYIWRDPTTADTMTRYDVAGTPAKVVVIEYARPYPGPGAAAAILKRRSGTARALDVDMLAQWATTPGQETSITFPNADDQDGKVSSVRFSLGDDGLMTVGTKGLIDIPAGSWLARDPAQTWNAVPTTETWNTLTATQIGADNGEW